MIRHIVAWSFKDGFTNEEKKDYALKIKTELEALPSIIGGIIKLDVQINLLPSSTKSAMLNSLFESEEALNAYQTHPEHKKISAFVGTVMEHRVCLDYQE